MGFVSSHRADVQSNSSLGYKARSLQCLQTVSQHSSQWGHLQTGSTAGVRTPPVKKPSETRAVHTIPGHSAVGPGRRSRSAPHPPALTGCVLSPFHVCTTLPSTHVLSTQKKPKTPTEKKKQTEKCCYLLWVFIDIPTFDEKKTKICLHLYLKILKYVKILTQLKLCQQSDFPSGLR